MKVDRTVKLTRCHVCGATIVRYVYGTLPSRPDPVRCSACIAKLVNRRNRRLAKMEAAGEARAPLQ